MSQTSEVKVSEASHYRMIISLIDGPRRYQGKGNGSLISPQLVINRPKCQQEPQVTVHEKVEDPLSRLGCNNYLCERLLSPLYALFHILLMRTVLGR